MPFYRVTYKGWFDEVEAINEDAARIELLHEFVDYGATSADLYNGSLEVEEVAPPRFQDEADESEYWQSKFGLPQ